MIHYHVWFTFKPAVNESTGLAIAREFMAELQAGTQVSRCSLLSNMGGPSKSRLPRYHAFFEFADDEQMEAAFAKKRTEGIHHGAHGKLIESVAEFHVEVFREIP